MQEATIRRATAPHVRTTAIVTLALALACAAGCGKSAQRSGPTGDVSGAHLLVFATTRASGTTSEYDVALYDADAGGYRAVAGLNSSYSQSEPCISDDAGFVCFASARPSGAGGSDVYVYSRSAQALLATPGLNTVANETYPRFTHDALRLVFVRDSIGIRRIRMYEPLGDTLIRLPGIDSPGGDDDDAPAPDLHGNRIAFQSGRSGATHVYVWNRGLGVADLPALIGDTLDAEPSLSANGRWLAFASSRSGGAGGWDVYLYDLQAAAFVRLPRLDTAGDERHPAVSADGRVLFFVSRPDTTQNWSLWRYTLADSNRTQPVNLAAPAGDDRQPYLLWR